ncbi:MAG: pullulanase [Ignavibacteriaceae bacterium]|nr:pullulanase [Ignavibacteriaceae bacterium]
MKHSIIILAAIVFSIFTKNNALGENLFITDKTTSKEIFTSDSFVKDSPSDKIYSDKKLGVFFEDGKTYFRLFTPNAQSVSVVVFNKVDEQNGTEYSMTRDDNAVWEAAVDGELFGKFYGFKITSNTLHNGNRPLCLDPYAKAVATYNTYMNPRKGIIIKPEEYDWEGTDWQKRDWRDLIIYEMHVRDMTADVSSGAEKPGTYKGLVEKGKTGGIDYIKNLGVNSVELLPTQEFGNCEIPYKDSVDEKFNTWNPYERNHWGYMTAAFFAPDAYYSEDGNNFQWNTWSGAEAKQVNDFKDMVKAFHKEGIGVIMDVVYNHISEYELGNLKQIDKEYYFRLNSSGGFEAQSGCGNDFKTESPMARRMIVESVLYWMTEYKVDGFRFDLGKLLDWETIEEIIYQAQKINPDVVFVCEPWGGGYDPMGFSLRGWGVWNDQIRNGIKGENPDNGNGWIFGKWYGNNSPQRIKSYVNGTLIGDSLGLFQKKEHSVNYLESHDGYTLGDFIRIGTGELDPDIEITDIDANAKLTPLQMKLNKLGALFLFTSQGMTMIQAGQEFARSKVVPIDVKVDDPLKGRIDHNTYDKDNQVNYINYKHAQLNKELVDYYKGLTALRNTYDAFRRADYDDVKFMDVKYNPFALGYTLNYKKDNFVLLFNASPDRTQEFTLPKGKYQVLVNPLKAGVETLDLIDGIIVVPTSSGYVLKKK